MNVAADFIVEVIKIKIIISHEREDNKWENI